jgi:APA family basic amino acid/polyamine antiporter
VAVAAIALGALANTAGVRLAAGVGEWLAIAKIGLLVLLVALGFASGAGDVQNFLPLAERRPGAPPLVPALAGAVISAFFSFGGWWEASKLAGEVRDAQRTVGRALALGVATVTLLYVAVSAVFLYLVPLEAVTSGETFAAQAGAALFGASGARVLAALVAFSILSSLVAFMTMAPRVYYAMARDGAAPAFAGRLHPRSGAPVNAIAVQATLAALLVLAGSFDAIVAYFVFVTVCFLGLTVLGLFRLRARGAEAPFTTPFHPVTPALFLLSVVVVLALFGSGRPREAGLGVAVVALGLPAYTLLRRSQRA